MSISDKIEREGGSPEFETPGRVRDLEVSQGDDFQASTSIGNHGGRAEGLVVEVCGDVVEKGLVAIESIGMHGGATQERVERAAEERPGEDGDRRFVAEFPDLDIAGALAEDVDFSDMSDERGREVMRAHRASRMSVYVSGEAVEAGSGELRINIAPADAPERSVSESASLTVFPSSRRPLKAEDEPPPHTLRQMAKEETLFGLVHFNAPVGAWAEYATEAMARWNGLVAGGGDRYIRVEVPSGEARPNEDEVAATAFDEQGLQDLTRRLPDLDQFSVVLSGPAINQGRLEPHKSGGFSYFSCAGPLSGGGEPAPALGFWLSTDGRTDRQIADLRRSLTEIVDALAGSGYMLQGMVDTWAWAPALKIRSLPYEIVCGLHSAGHLRCDWLGRYLRAVTRKTWLGVDLADRLDVDPIENHADVDRIDGALRIALGSSEKLNDLERVLASILPGEEEWSVEAG